MMSYHALLTIIPSIIQYIGQETPVILPIYTILPLKRLIAYETLSTCFQVISGPILTFQIVLILEYMLTNCVIISGSSRASSETKEVPEQRLHRE